MNIKDYKHIHMIGIGGISMSGIAELLQSFGIYVTGSDASESETTNKLMEKGIRVFINHSKNNVEGADLVVYTAAVKSDNIEYIEANKKNIPIIERSEFLGELTKLYKDVIAVSGTHGKTTTTSMISLAFIEGFLDPTVQVGAMLKGIDGNYRIGQSDYFILEACEYVESFLQFHPKTEIILNIDNDHLDYFKNFENIKNAFLKYVKILPENGLLVINADDESCLEVAKEGKTKVVTYGIVNITADFTVKNISFDDNGFYEFDVLYKGKLYEHFSLSVPGMHNVSNALACIAVCHEYGINKLKIKKALVKFTGAHRRFEYVGSFDEVRVFDDYGHHPTEVKAVASALKNMKYNKSFIVFQPHTYSRTKELLDEFAEVLTEFDNIIVTDIYAAREKDEYGVSSKDLVDKIKSLGKNAIYISYFSDIVDYLKKNTNPNDIILTQGAGTITNLGKMLLR